MTYKPADGNDASSTDEINRLNGEIERLTAWGYSLDMEGREKDVAIAGLVAMLRDKKEQAAGLRREIKTASAIIHRMEEQEVRDERVIASFVKAFATDTAAAGDSFDEVKYLRANPDVAEAVTTGRYASGLKHWQSSGMEECRKGQRRAGFFDYDDVYDERAYLLYNPDIASAVRSGKYASGYHHWITEGIAEHKAGSRNPGFVDETHVRQRDVIIFGAGEGGKRALRIAERKGWKTLCFLDNNSKAWDTEGPDGIFIRPPAILKSGAFAFDEIIVASKPGKAAIFAQLESMGFKAYEDFVYFGDLEFSFPEIDPQLESWLGAYKTRGPVNIAEPLTVPGRTVPTVSVIIPVHNQAEYTYRCLLSITQNPPKYRFEVIVVDDASTDATPGMLRSIEGIRVVTNASNQGFIRSCNAGAKEAKGDFLYFLNNDTEVMPGWLDELVETFNAFPDTGLAGGKLIWPNGVLQEAGGLFWKDGSAWNYGREGDPNKPEFSYLRQADYVSGASIMVRANVFAKLGGFDELYLPAYGEDSDLAFKIRALGYKTFYQPLSRVIHHEGVSCGKSVTAGIKAYQVDNAKKLYERWRKALESHRPNGERPELEKDRGVVGRALFIDAITPTPDQDAGSVTTIGLMKIFQELGYKVTFIPQDCILHMGDYTRNLQRMGVECVYAPYYSSVESYLKEAGDIFDVALVFRYTEFARCVDAIERLCPSAKIIFEVSDLHHIREERQAVVENSKALAQQAVKTRQNEIGLMRRAHVTLVRSEAERDIIRSQEPDLDVTYYPWAIDIRGRTASFNQRAGVTFIGGYQHPPNADAVLYFTREIFPIIRSRLPEVEFHIYGSKAPQEILGLDNDGVKVHGFVRSVSECFDNHRVFVAPLRYGAGFKGKVAQSMSYGLPCALTSVAAEGMGFTDGLNCLVADKPEEFAEAVIRLYTDQRLWLTLSDQSVARARELCSFDAGRAVMRRALEKLGAPLPPRKARRGLLPAGVLDAVADPLIHEKDGGLYKTSVLRERGYGALRFRCNICGGVNEASVDALTREDPSCAFCKCSVRFRSMIHLLSIGLFGKSLALDEFPENKRIKGIGLSDWDGYASRLAGKLDYTNTFYHVEPKLDINDIPPAMEGTLDFIISSDVFEHTPPPVSQALGNSLRLLKPGGTLALSVPFTRGEPVEYYPDLHDYKILETDGKYTLFNTTKSGEKQVFENPAFHDGGGLTLVMRMFTEHWLLDEMKGAGFSTAAPLNKNFLPHGVYWQYGWGYPFIAKK
jgi:GT2 family glycosyltransferase/SAM-dependent methyltransferase